MRIDDHPILGPTRRGNKIEIIVDGKTIEACDGEPIAVALIAAGISTMHYTEKRREPRGVFCAIGRCTDCVMTVNGVPNVRTCITPVENGMVVETQAGLGTWRT